MRNSLLGVAAAAAAVTLIAGVSSTARAAGTLVYGMEGGTLFAPDGFSPNGGGTIAKVTGAGVTQGTFALQDDLLAGDTFVGALTQNPLPPVLVSPSTTAVQMDVTLPTAYAGSNAVILVTYFAYHDPDDIPGTGDETAFGTPFQFDAGSIFHADGKAAGTYTAVVDLLEHFSHGPMAPLFNDPNPATDWDLGGFQITLSKDNTAPLSVIIDNVQALPEPASILGVFGLAGLALRRKRQ